MENVDASLLEALIQTESSGNPNAINPATGARGLGQTTPIAWKDLVKFYPEVYKKLDYKTDIFKPDVSRRATSDYLNIINKYLTNYKIPTTPENVLASYNWGIGNVKKYGVTNAPKETKNYIQKILNIIKGGSQ